MDETRTTPWTRAGRARNGDVELAFDRFAEGGDGEPLLLVMGLGVSRRWWPEGLCRALAGQGFAVARYDQRDAGESTHLPPAPTGNPVSALFRKRGEAYTAEDMADDAIAVMDALGWESAHLFGHSLGGAVAQRIALRHPDRVRTLTSSAAVPGDEAGLGTLRYIRLRTLARFTRLKFPDTEEGRVEAGLAVARILASPGYPFDEREARERIEADGSEGVHDQQAQSRQIGAQWHGPGIGALTVPALVLHGEDDPLIRPAAGKKTAARIPGARLVTLPGVGHDLPGPVWDTVAGEVARNARGR